MYEWKNIWQRMGIVGRIVAITGASGALTLLISGHGLWAVVLLASALLVCFIYSTARLRQRLRDWGVLTYVAPDGETVEVAYDDMCQDIRRFVGRRFTLCYPYDGVNADGAWDTGFGLLVDARGLPCPRRGEMITITGVLQVEGNVVSLAVSLVPEE